MTEVATAREQAVHAWADFIRALSKPQMTDEERVAVATAVADATTDLIKAKVVEARDQRGAG